MILDPAKGFGRKARGCTRRFYVAVTLLLGVSLLFSSLSVVAQEAPLPADQVKAAFLYNFAKFIQWPPHKFATPDAKLVIGVLGRNPFGKFLDEIGERKIGPHPIEIIEVSSAKEAIADGCHILFIGQDRRRAAQTVEQLSGADVLTITDEVEEDSFKSVGAVINLITTANKTVHFEINVDAARRAELQINSSLLNLAKIVRDGKA